jgi:hypothetical protein
MAVLIVLAGCALIVQLITDRPSLGGFGLILLAVPSLVLARALGPRPLAWPQVVLVTLGGSLVLAVLTAVLTALSAHGLDASSFAAGQLLALAGAVGLWLLRVRRGESNVVRLSLRVKPGSVVLVVVGLVLGAAGFFVAKSAAEDHAAEAFIQFWSVPPTTAGPQVIGVRNDGDLTVNCQVTIDRPDKPDIDLLVGPIDAGQAWGGSLPPKVAPDPGPWQLRLHCSTADGQTFDRRLTIDPPAA